MSIEFISIRILSSGWLVTILSQIHFISTHTKWNYIETMAVFRAVRPIKTTVKDRDDMNTFLCQKINAWWKG